MKIPEKIKRVARLEKKSLITRGLKLCEEAGELAAEILKYYDEKPMKEGETKEIVLSKIHLEATDSLLMACDILIKSGATDKIINDLVNQQLAKWEGYLKNKNNEK